MSNELTVRDREFDNSYQCSNSSLNRSVITDEDGKTDEDGNRVAFWTMVGIGAVLALMYLPSRPGPQEWVFIVLNTLVPTSLVGWMSFGTPVYNSKFTAFASAAAMLLFVIPINILASVGGDLIAGISVIICVPLVLGLSAACVVYLLACVVYLFKRSG